MPLDEQDLAAVESAMVRAVVEADELRLLGPVEALPAYRRASLLLSMRRSSHARVSAAARDALRAMPALKVLPAIEAQLRAGDLSLLDVVGAAGAVPSVLAEIAQTSKESAPWVRFCLRVAGASVLFAAGLAPRIASWTAEDPSPQALSLLSRLSDWCDAAHAKALLGPLAPALAGARREAFLDAILGALREQPAMLVVPVLSWMAKPSDARVVRALAEAEAASPGIADLLEPALRSAVRRALRTALESAGPEQARKLLSYFANRVEQPAERSDVVELLARYVGSPSRRVSLHAHRLLRVTAPRERYLRATRALLDDTDPTTVRLALRVLSFGGDADSTAEIAEKLFHPHDAVARAAREGLLALGTRAVGPLQKARARARPDRRAAIDAVLEEIRAKEA